MSNYKSKKRIETMYLGRNLSQEKGSKLEAFMRGLAFSLRGA